MSLSPQFLDELRARTLLSGLVGRTTPLKRAGREFKGCCPFHQEKTASFYVNDDKAFYHCFGCGAHGDAMRFLTDAQGMTFMDAVKELAAAAGMDVPAPDPRAQERADRLKPLLDLTERAAAFYARQRDVRAVQAYLEQRGISAAISDRFRIGFAPDGGGELRAALRDAGDALMIEAGLLVAPEDDRAPYDRFRARLIFPIEDARGRVIAFGGRIIGKGEPKYLNSPETPLFDKGRSLFNVRRGAAAAKMSGRLIVVEGYMDVIGLAGAGIDDVVAPNGTALTEAQLEIMWRIVETPTLCFDGDEAGQRAMVKAAVRALPMLEPGRSLMFVRLFDGQDPDDIVRAGGRAGFDRAMSASMQLVDVLWVHELAQTRVTSPEARAGLRTRLGEHAKAIKSTNVRDQYLAEFKDRFERRFAATPRGPAPTASPTWSKRPPPPIGETRAIASGALNEAMLRAILAGLMRYPQVAVSTLEQLGSLRASNDRYQALIEAMVEAAIAGRATAEALPMVLQVHGLAGAPAALRSGHKLPFSFLVDGADPEQAAHDLEEAIFAQAAGR